MKNRILIVVFALLLGTSLPMKAQTEEQIDAFVKKYENVKDCEVTVVKGTMLRIAALAADKETRKMLKKLDLMMSIEYKNPENNQLTEDFEALLNGFEKMGPYEKEEVASAATIYFSDQRGFAMVLVTPEAHNYVLMLGKGLNLEEMMSEEQWGEIDKEGTEQLAE